MTTKRKSATVTITVAVEAAARAIVYDVLHDLDPSVKPGDKIALKKYGLDDDQSKDGLAQEIYRKHRVFIDYPTIEGCDTVGDVIAAVSKAMKNGARHA